MVIFECAAVSPTELILSELHACCILHNTEIVAVRTSCFAKRTLLVFCDPLYSDVHLLDGLVRVGFGIQIDASVL